MALEHYIRSGQRLLRCGYTTGTCAALAASGAVSLLLTGSIPPKLSVLTGKGIAVSVEPDDFGMDGNTAWCAVVKDAGDDADVTDGIQIVACVSRMAECGVSIDGGAGIGTVTKEGLDQPVGAAAINRVPRKMIEQAVLDVCDELGYDGGIQVVISAPHGDRIAAHTFNPMLGIAGGISILGTSGIVEPMSEKAIVDTIAVQLHQARMRSADVILTPGNYGQEFLRRQKLDRWDVPVVKSSNFIGDSLDIAVSEHFERVLLVGHAGKLIKLAGGIMNTHSKWADCRAELICAYAAVNGADTALCRRLMDAATTDACLAILEEAGIRWPVMAQLMDAVQCHLERRVGPDITVGAILFSNEYGLLGKTQTVEEILRKWTRRGFFTE